jgi:hypothetical protein
LSLEAGAGRPDEFGKKSPKISPNFPFILKSRRDLSRGIKVSRHLRFFGNFEKSAQRKQSPNGRKFAQSGHPELELFLE